ncbi:ABC transporter permease [Ancylobacter sonchi]|uniref:ABC transporter permease n=1 Tax=Ancylobacter sonchi TaxID=1937790 RepID=UPI001BD3AB72|nr:ABC transporter permease [Ancylobacter sonchi]MBS7536000.1 ABC transporter permease [Ancylobacter sonchi]
MPAALHSYTARRIAQTVLVVILTYVLVFFILFILPGDPIQQQIENPQNPIPAADAKILLQYYHVDRSGLDQFWIALRRLAQGDLGYSLTTGKPVASLILQAIPQTLALASTALLFTGVIAFTIALAAAFAPSSVIRGIARALPGAFLATPSFLVGFLLLQLFSFQLGWVSAIRDEGFKSVILPALALAIAVSGPIAQVLIQGLNRAYGEPFVTVLRARGLGEARIVLGHVLRNAAIPTVTLLGLTLGELLAGSVVTETIFSRTGIGFLTQQAVREQDAPVILAVVMLVSTVFALTVLVTDLIYPLIDPRIAARPIPATADQASD